MYAAKEAIMTIEHARAGRSEEGDSGSVQCQVFFMDTRAYSKGYEEYYRRAESKYGVKYTRCRLSDVKQDSLTGNLKVRYFASYENGKGLVEEEFDLVVLSVGMEISESVKLLGKNLGIELDRYGFCHTTLFDPLQTSRPGIYVAGPFREPKDIPETVMEASGAAASAARLLSDARNTLTIPQTYPDERDISAEPPRIGVFVCHCGSNIGGYLDVPGVAEYATMLPGVVHAEDNLYTCSQDTIAHIIEQVQELQLNRVVVASCTPLTHEPLFQEALRKAGLNPHLFEMANIRNQCSWVHSSDWEGASEKAKKLVRMAVAKAAKLQPLRVIEMDVNHSALVVGGGAAGMTAALTLADQGYPVHLVERGEKLGGNLRNLRFFLPDQELGNGFSPQEYLAMLIYQVQQHSLINVYLETELIDTEGFKGNFTSTLQRDGHMVRVQHGTTIVATGGEEYRGPEYGYGSDARIMTQMEFENTLSQTRSVINSLRSVVMIQCVGPAERYCSRLCCTTALKNAIKLKELNPQTEITIIFRDIRTYGFKERLYTEARRLGVRFIQYEFDRKPEVFVPDGGAQEGGLTVKVLDKILGREITLEPDLLVLSTPVVPSKGTRDLASRLKLSVGMDGFFLEAHVKLRPVDFVADGVFMAGMAHYPKFLDESIAQAKAAASRAAITLSKEKMLTNARVAVVDPLKCVGCLTCVRICPYDVPRVSDQSIGVGGILGAAYIEPAVCHGCGSCAAECPAQAIQLKYYTDTQTLTKVDALFERSLNGEGFVPVGEIFVNSQEAK
jgi:heterodisulfide reductase subunit A-like polyferredoxin